MYLLPKVLQQARRQTRQPDLKESQHAMSVIIHHAEQQNKQARIKMPEQTKLHSKKLISCVFN